MVHGWHSHSPTFAIHEPFIPSSTFRNGAGDPVEFMNRKQSRRENPNPFMHVVLRSDWCPPAENLQGENLRIASVPTTNRYQWHKASLSFRILPLRHADTKRVQNALLAGMCAATAGSAIEYFWSNGTCGVLCRPCTEGKPVGGLLVQN